MSTTIIHATALELGLLVNFGHYPKLESAQTAITVRKHQRVTQPKDFRP